MKKYLTIVVAVFTAIFTLQPFTTYAALKEAPPDKIDLTVFSNNAGDGPDSLPFIIMTFRGISKDEAPQIVEWKKEIDAKLALLGGVTKKEDYVKVMQIIPDYFERFVSTGASSITIDFTITRQKITLMKKKSTPPPKT